MKYDDEARAQVVREWLRSPLRQIDFCAKRNLSPRVLREWTRRYSTGARPEARVIEILDRAIASLHLLRGALAEPACRSEETECNSGVERHAGSGGSAPADREGDDRDPDLPLAGPSSSTLPPPTREEQPLSLGARELQDLVQAVREEFQGQDAGLVHETAAPPAATARRRRGSFFAGFD